MQPCLSPVWDTVLASHALAQAGARSRASGAAPGGVVAAGEADAAAPAIGRGATRRAPGGWYFEHRNEFYPDVDDTCMALMVLRHARADVPEAAQEAAVQRGLTWMLGMQNADGGWASFDRDNDKQWLTEVPFADHNAMIDPSTADITGRVLECLSHFPRVQARRIPVVRRAIDFLRRDQTSDGCVVRPLGRELHLRHLAGAARCCAAIGEDIDAPYVRRGVRWLRTTRTPTAAGARASRATTIPPSAASAPRRPARPPGR